MARFFARWLSMMSAIMFVLGVIEKGNPWLLFPGSFALLGIGLALVKWDESRNN